MLIIQCFRNFFSTVFTMKPFVHDDILVLIEMERSAQVMPRQCKGGPGARAPLGKWRLNSHGHVNEILNCVVCTLCTRSVGGSVFLVGVGTASRTLSDAVRDVWFLWREEIKLNREQIFTKSVQRCVCECQPFQEVC